MEFDLQFEIKKKKQKINPLFFNILQWNST